MPLTTEQKNQIKKEFENLDEVYIEVDENSILRCEIKIQEAISIEEKKFIVIDDRTGRSIPTEDFHSTRRVLKESESDDNKSELQKSVYKFALMFKENNNHLKLLVYKNETESAKST